MMKFDKIAAPIPVTDLRDMLGVGPKDDLLKPIRKAFTNKQANAVTHAELVVFASRLGCTLQQLKAVAKVESGGGGFTNSGLPKILFERHHFHRHTDGKWSPSIFSNRSGGGYSEDSWAKLAAAAARDVDAAFGSCSWGKFQVLGSHWSKLGYPSSLALAHTTTMSEGDHYELLCRYIEVFGLLKATRKLSPNPDDCRDFAAMYNGPAYRKFNYHTKLASAMG